ncbi:unnamed protein product [Nesidiocoris tenuis]|uniref:PHD-type domain-containing protein n=1 Tax=Nesidiocoris tenuis TaxID=355587 RepID=A0A6H5H965_9HEMI|nr:unnamed protein product [Nesidiocoris tenuis]
MAKKKLKNKDICPVCSAKVEADDRGLQCDGNCRTWYHCDCAGLTSSFYDGLGDSDNWYCADCEIKQRPTQQTSGTRGKKKTCNVTENNLSTSDLTPLKIEDVNPSLQVMATALNQLVAAVVDIRKSLIYQSDKYDEFWEEMKCMKEDTHRVSKEVATVHETTKELVNENKALTQRVNSLEQRLIANELVIDGIPTTANENLRDTFFKICDAIKCKIGGEDIISLRRLAQSHQANSPKKGHQPIIVVLRNDACQQKVIDSKKSAGGITQKTLGFSSDEKIFINERLTPHCRYLFWLARQAKQIGFKYCWVKRGQIFLRRDEQSQALRINKESDIPTSTSTPALPHSPSTVYPARSFTPSKTSRPSQ